MRSRRGLSIRARRRHGRVESEAAAISRGATWLARLVLKTHISDPMSGFFVVSRRLSKLRCRDVDNPVQDLVDLFASAPQPLKLIEVPYEFRTRSFRERKLDSAVAWECLVLLADKLSGHIVPVRFVLFVAVGGLGLFVRLAALGLALNLLRLSFLLAQSVAVLVAMTFDFTVSNFFTYRSALDRAPFHLWPDLILFDLPCWGCRERRSWHLHLRREHHLVARGVAGAIVEAVWNYAVSSVFTWRK
jgi:dolichol-phosphate mannosyltransferase